MPVLLAIFLLFGHMMFYWYEAVYIDFFKGLLVWLVAGLVFLICMEMVLRSRVKLIARLKSYIFLFANLEVRNRMTYEIGFTPRHLIFVIDLLIVLLAALVNYKLLAGKGPGNFIATENAIQIGLYMLFHGMVFMRLNTHTGSIRHSTLFDALKLFMAVSVAHVLLFFVDGIYTLVSGSPLFYTVGLIYGLALTYVGLLIFRFGIKVTFHHLSNAKQADSGSRAVIYGVDSKAVSLVTALRMDENCRLNFVAFLGHGTHHHKSILDIPIVPKKNSVISTLHGLRASVLILATDKLTEREKFAIVEDCTKSNIKIFIPSLISHWSTELPATRKLRDLRIEDLLYRMPVDIDMGYLAAVLREKTVLVTGGAGSIGSEMALQLAGMGAKKIIVFDIAESPLHELEVKLLTLFPTLDFHSIVGDVTREEDVRNVFLEYRPHFVYHAAAYKHVPMMERHPAQAIKVNILGTKIVADLANEFHAERFILISTDKAVNPTNIMGATKRVAELYIQELSHKQVSLNGNSTKFVTTRFGNVLGSNGSVVPLFKRQISEGGPVTVTHLEITRYFMTIPEACQLVLIAGCKGEGGDIFLFDMGKPIRIMDLATRMIQLAGLEPHKEIEVKITGLRPGEKLYEELHSSSALVTPTDNPKISKVVEMNGHSLNGHSDEFHAIIHELSINLHTKRAYHLIRQLKNLVPEYRKERRSRLVNSHIAVAGDHHITV